MIMIAVVLAVVLVIVIDGMRNEPAERVERTEFEECFNRIDRICRWRSVGLYPASWCDFGCCEGGGVRQKPPRALASLR